MLGALLLLQTGCEMAVDLTRAAISFAAAAVGAASGRLAAWAVRKTQAHSPEGRRVMRRCHLVDIIAYALLFTLLVPAVMISLWLLVPVVVCGLFKTLFLETRLERRRDARVAACDAAWQASTARTP